LVFLYKSFYYLCLAPGLILEVEMKQKHLFLSFLLIISVVISGCTTSSESIGLTGVESQVNAPQSTLFTHETEIPITLDSSWVSPIDGMAMVYVPAGDFIMGTVEQSEYYVSFQQRTVTLDDFWIDKTEVTNAMFAAFVNDTGIQTAAEKVGLSGGIPGSGGPELIDGANWRNPLGPTINFSVYENHPVVNVNWYDAMAYCKWAGRRLPTEAEWEKAARGTDGRSYPWGNTPPTGNLVNFADVNANNPWADKNINDGYANSSPVGSYPDGMSPYGALDMAGNVHEWVDNWEEGSFSISENPLSESSDEEFRTMRGGSWNDGSYLILASSRVVYPIRGPSPLTGFRCAISGKYPITPTTSTAIPLSPEERMKADEVFSNGSVVYIYDIQPFIVSMEDLYEIEFTLQYILSKKAMVPGDPMLLGWMYNDGVGIQLVISDVPVIVDWVSEKGEFTVKLVPQEIGKPEYLEFAIIGIENNNFIALSNLVRIEITP